MRETRENNPTEVIERQQRAGDVVQYVLSTCKAQGLKASSADQPSVGTDETTNIRQCFPCRESDFSMDKIRQPGGRGWIGVHGGRG